MADLGFNVDTGGLDKAQASLDKTTQSAANTEQQANKTSAAISKIGADNASGSISKTAQSADQLAASLVKASSAAQQHLNVAQALEAIVTKTGVSYAAANTALTAAISANASAATAAGKHADELGKVAQAAATVTPRLTEAGNAAGVLGRALGSIGGGGGGLIGGLTAGLGGMALAAGGAGAAFLALGAMSIKVGDDFARAENRLQGITGSLSAGTKAFNQIKDAVAGNRAVFDPFERSLELASQNLNKLADGSWPVISTNATKVSGDLTKLTAVWDTLQKAMELNKATAPEEAQVLGAIAQAGGLTAQAFEKLNSITPTVGRAIAQAFHFQDIDEFRKHLEQTPIPLRELVAAMGPVKAYIDRTFDINAPQTFEQAMRGVTSAWNLMLDQMAQSGALDFVKTALGYVADQIKLTSSDLQQLQTDFHNLGQAASQEIAGITADFIKLGNVIASVASAIASAGAAAASVSGGLAVPGGDMGGIQLSPDSSGGGDQSSYGYFATGGSFTVQGSGGTDSQLVQFHATPGEVVTISGGAGSSDMGGTTLAPSGHVDTGGSSGDMAVIDAIDNSARAIVNAIHQLSGGISLNGAANSITSGVASATTAGGLSLQELLLGKLGPGGGGLASGGGSSSGGSSSTSTSTSDKNKQKLIQASQQGGGNQDSGNFVYGGTSATPGSNKGAFGVNVPPSLQSGVNFINPTDPFHPFNTLGGGGPFNLLGGSDLGGAGVDTGVKTAVKDTTTAVQGTTTAVDGTTTAVNTSGDDTVSAVASGSSSIVSSISSMGASIAAAIAAAASSSASAGASGAGYYGGSGNSYGGGSYYGGGGSYDSGGGLVYPGSSGSFDLGGGSEIGGSIGNGNMTGGGGFDPSMIDYGGGDPSLGYFATGGQFHVAGRGGIDSQPVRFMATPGEVVTVTPPGIMPPPSPTGVTRNGRGGHFGNFATGGQFSPGGAYLGGGYTYASIPTPPSGGSSGGTIERIADGVAKAVTRAIPGAGHGPSYEDNQPSKWGGGDGASVPAAPRSEEQKTGSNLGGDRNVTIVVQAGVQAEQFLRSRAQIARAFRG